MSAIRVIRAIRGCKNSRLVVDTRNATKGAAVNPARLLKEL